MMMLRFPSLALAALLFCSAPAALAQGAPITNGATSTDLATAHAQLRRTTAELQVEVNDLKADNARLTGELETLQFNFNQLQQELEAMRGDDRELSSLISNLERSVADLESALGDVERVASEPTESRGPMSLRGDEADPEDTDGEPTVFSDLEPREESEEESEPKTIGFEEASTMDFPGGAREVFAEAKSRLVQSDYAGAEELFRGFLGHYSGDPQAGEAQYWLGESLFRQDLLPEAGEAYKRVLDDYPNDAKAPDALVKLARTLRLIGNSDTACAVLAQLPRRYPEASGLTRNTAAVERVRSGCS